MVTTLIPERTLNELEDRIGVRFSDRSLLGLALVHSSFLNENPETEAQSNERIEFLGDAVVDLAIGQALFDRASTASEGQLTAVRALVVRSEALARAASRLGIGEYLLLGKGERSHGGAERISNLADAFEAVVGAIFLDRGYEAARQFVVGSLDEELTRALAASSPKDPKSLLQEVAQAAGWGPPSYRVVDSAGPDHMRRFTIEVLVRGQVAGTGEGARKVDAEREAASRALEALADTTRTI
ncbi:MAG: ribonuclease III [Chloroflexi bacterium]|nr:ribonuclease III [Chloroflexota bacterium]